MIKPDDLQEWLNQFSVSHLGQGATRHLRALNSPDISETEFNRVRRAFDQPSRLQMTPLEHAEALFHCALSELGHSRLEESLQTVQEVLQVYAGSENQDHRVAVVLWLQGILQWRLRDNFEAYESWRLAYEHYVDLSDQSVKTRAAEKVRWYSKHLHDMAVELAATAPEAYAWLHRYEPSALSNLTLASANQAEGRGSLAPGHEQLDALMTLVAQIDLEIRKNQRYATAIQLVEHLKNAALNSPNPGLLPDVLVEGGLAACQMDLPHEAEELLRLAAIHYRPFSHQQAVTNWMLGIALWQMKGAEDEALAAWRKSIDGFEFLCGEANEKNRQEQFSWYRERAEILKQALQDKINSRFGHRD